MKHQLCRNCGQHVEGLYCSNCGQKGDVERLRLTTLADSFISTFVGDGAIGEKRNNIRYGFLLTLWSIVIRPANTVQEYLEGRRRKYFNPVTILLLLSGFYALIGVFLGVVNDTPKPSDSEFTYFLNVIMAYSSSHPAMLHLFMLPFMALTYKWLFRRRSDLRYIEMMYIGIFAAIFSVLTNILELPFDAFPALKGASSYVSTVRYAALCWFTATVFHKLFHISWKRAIVYWITSFILSLVVLVLTIVLIVSAVGGIYHLTDPEGLKQTVSTIFEEDSETVKNAADSLQVK